MKRRGEGIEVVATNRKARRDYEIEETYEAGLVLMGTEVKSLRRRSCSLRDGEVFLYNVYIAPYEGGSHYNPDPERPRKLLLHKQEIARLAGRVKERGYTLIPLKIYSKDGYAKVELALARGVAKHDLREKLRREEQEREIHRALKEFGRGSRRA